MYPVSRALEGRKRILEAFGTQRRDRCACTWCAGPLYTTYHTLAEPPALHLVCGHGPDLKVVGAHEDVGDPFTHHTNNPLWGGEWGESGEGGGEEGRSKDRKDRGRRERRKGQAHGRKKDGW